MELSSRKVAIRQTTALLASMDARVVSRPDMKFGPYKEKMRPKTHFCRSI